QELHQESSGHSSQPHQDPWIAHVVVGEEEGVRIRVQQDVTVRQVHSEGDSFAIFLESRQQLLLDEERRSSVGRALHYARQGGGFPTELRPRDAPLAIFARFLSRHLKPFASCPRRLASQNACPILNDSRYALSPSWRLSGIPRSSLTRPI